MTNEIIFGDDLMPESDRGARNRGAKNDSGGQGRFVDDSSRRGKSQHDGTPPIVDSSRRDPETDRGQHIDPRRSRTDDSLDHDGTPLFDPVIGRPDRPTPSQTPRRDGNRLDE